MTATRMGSTEWAGVGNRDVILVIQGLTFLSQKKNRFSPNPPPLPPKSLKSKKILRCYIEKMHLPFIHLVDNTTVVVMYRVIK